MEIYKIMEKIRHFSKIYNKFINYLNGGHESGNLCLLENVVF